MHIYIEETGKFHPFSKLLSTENADPLNALTDRVQPLSRLPLTGISTYRQAL